MDCVKFTNWLENRDTFDLSVADKALKHAATCPDCSAKLQLDEQLDVLIVNALRAEEAPGSLRDKIDISLDGFTEKKSKGSYRLYGIFSAVMAAMFIFVMAFTLTSSPPTQDLKDMGKYVVYDHGHHGDEILMVENPSDLYRLGDIQVDYAVVKKQIPQDFTFVGARICPLGDCEAVHLVYNQKDKRFSVYMIKTSDVDFTLPSGKRFTVEAEGQVVDFWRDGGYIYAMIG